MTTNVALRSALRAAVPTGARQWPYVFNQPIASGPMWLPAISAAGAVDLDSLSEEALSDAMSKRRTAERQVLAQEFARAATHLVEEVWLNQDWPGTLVTALTLEANLDDELELEALFRLIVRERGQAFDAELDVFALSGAVPERARSGRRLLP